MDNRYWQTIAHKMEMIEKLLAKKDSVEMHFKSAI